MKRRTGEIQVFSTSFLDLLSCGLGGVLLLFLYSFTQNQQETAAHAQQRANMQKQIDQAHSQLQQAEAALDRAHEDIDELAKAKRELENAQATLIGFKGDLTHVVFVLDTSGSMKDNRFDSYKDTVKEWIQRLEFERFNVVAFSTDVRPWSKSELMDASPANRDAAIAFVDSLSPDGLTNTLGAIQNACNYPGVKTVILVSDGAPTQFKGGNPVLDANGHPVGEDIAMQDVLTWLKNNGRGVVVNTIGAGDYFRESYGPFLQQIAHDTGGMFIGR